MLFVSAFCRMLS